MIEPGCENGQPVVELMFSTTRYNKVGVFKLRVNEGNKWLGEGIVHFVYYDKDCSVIILHMRLLFG